MRQNLNFSKFWNLEISLNFWKLSNCIFLLGHVMSCQVRAYHDLPCNIRPCLDNWLLSYYQDEGWFLCHIILWRVITCYLMQCYVRPVHAILNHAMPYHVRLLISHTITRLVAEYYHLKGFMPCHIMPFCADMQKHATLTTQGCKNFFTIVDISFMITTKLVCSIKTRPLLCLK